MPQRLDDELAVLDDQDESVRIAVRALGDMRNSGRGSSAMYHQSSPASSSQPTPALSMTSRSTSPSLPSPSIGGESVREREKILAESADSSDFVSRVSTLPIVNTALRAYEQSKASSRVVKYGAEMMESSVRTISKPVIDRLPVNVNQLDEFACRQLDRLGSYGRRPSSRDQLEGEQDNDGPGTSSYRTPDEGDTARAWTSAVDEESSSTALRGRSGRHTSPDRWKGKDRDVSMVREENTASKPQDSHSRTPTPRQDPPDGQQQVAQRSRWQAVLLEAGGIGAAMSEESMKRLKYCLQWLQYATAHIDSQILALRDFIAALQQHASGDPSAPPLPQHLQTLTAIRRDVVSTVRQVVDVVSKYAGGALPEPARARVRSFILCLPERWAKAASGEPVNGAPLPGDGAGTGGKVDHKVKSERVGRTRARASAAPYTYGPGEAGPSPHSRPASRATSPSHGRQALPPGSHPTPHSMQQAAQKILTLALESIDMLRAVTQVFKESLDKADAWVERLRIVGIQRPTVEAPPTLPPASSLLSPPPHPNGISSSPSSSSTSPTNSTFAPSSYATAPSSYLSPSSASSSRSSYREPLPPIDALSPSTSNAPSPSPMSPYGSLRELQLPPLGPGAYTNGNSTNGSHNVSYPHSEFGAMSIGHGHGSRSGSRAGSVSLPVSGYNTPRSGWPDEREWGRDIERERERERDGGERDRGWNGNIDDRDRPGSSSRERRDSVNGKMDVDS
ncbi:Opi1-domain-containing protein [Panus rudis PR-1116 ss-1]|nr:Opi1-domain-containing protein [Panus rudis PR-1116 ss-1]